MDQQTKHNKQQEATVTKLEKLVSQLLIRVRALEIENTRLKGTASRHHFQLHAHDRTLQRITNRE